MATTVAEPSNVVDVLDNLEGVEVNFRFQLKARVNSGGFGKIYLAWDKFSKEEVIAKVERASSSLAMREIQFIQDLNERCKKLYGSMQAPIAEFYDYFTCEDYIVTFMEALGPTLRDLRKMTPGDRFNMSTSLFVGRQMIQALYFLHSAYIVHGDVKPTNFCIGRFPQKSREVYIIDFGISRRHTPNNESRKRSEGFVFAGTTRYASLQNHYGYDDGILGDLWSVYYTLIECLLGQLPWRYETDKARVVYYKKMLTDLNIATGAYLHPWFPSAPGPPPSVLHFLHCLQKCQYSNQFNHQSVIANIDYDLAQLGFNQKGFLLTWENKYFVEEYHHKFWISPIPPV